MAGTNWYGMQQPTDAGDIYSGPGNSSMLQGGAYGRPQQDPNVHTPPPAPNMPPKTFGSYTPMGNRGTAPTPEYLAQRQQMQSTPGYTYHPAPGKSLPQNYGMTSPPPPPPPTGSAPAPAYAPAKYSINTVDGVDYRVPDTFETARGRGF